MVRIAHVSDIHFGDADPRVLAVAKATLNALAPDVVVATGDITQAGRKREFAAARAWFAEIAAPVIGCPGNHDAPVYALHRRFTTPFARFRALGLAAEWRAPDGAAEIVTLNTARALQWRLDWSQGAYAPRDLARALDRRDGGWRVIACHHPPVTPEGAALAVRTRGGAAALTRLERSVRTILLCGHVHAFTCRTVGGVMLATAPSLASSRERGDGLGFALLDLDRTSWRLTRYIWASDGFEPLRAMGPAVAA
jgi:3',5'-cyclic AMP phosphodiesterase CpdA